MDQPDDSQSQEQTTQQPGKSSSGQSQSNHIRSRITVVCAECKRLKLRCDRRSPCGSCVKRDTVDRCKYSQAATEKVDLQSVNNRVLVLEAQVASLNSGNNVPRPIPQPDRTFAIGNSGSSLAVSLDDVTSIWLSHLSPSIKLKLETAPVDLPTDDLLPATLFPPINTFRSSSSPLEPPSVTKQLMAMLPPSPETRHRLLLAVEETLALHPCFNFPHFQTRIHSMFSWVKEFESTSLQDQFSDSTATRASKPTLSFFGAVSAAFALGSLVTKTDDNSSVMMICDDSSFISGSVNGSTPPTDDSFCSSAALFALSEQSLSVFEKSYSYDLDYLVAMILQIIFLLHHGKPRLAHTLFPLVGKMVNIARMMGLSIDPDDFPGTYPLFEAETRRRIWWDVFYYDLFVSDFMGHPPLIADNSFTTKLPADVDEQQFNPFSTSLPFPQEWCKTSNVYFGMKCRLAQLVKDLKKRMFRDPLSSHSESELTIEKAAEFESRISEFTANLPSEYQINLNSGSLPSSNDSYGLLILARACELHTVANRLVVSLYLPFLKANRSNPPHQASLAIANSAHKIIQAIKIWKVGMSSGPWNDKGRWGSFGVYYEYRRILFDAAVVCASMSIDCHDSVFAQCVKEDVDVALEIMRDIEETKMSGRRPLTAGVGSGLEGNVSEGVKIVEMLGKKAEALRTGMRRKRQDTDRDVLMPGFMLPYVGAGVSSAGAINDSQDMASSQTSFAPATTPKISRKSLDLGPVKVKVEATKSELLLDSKKRFLERSDSMEPEKKKPGKGKEKDKTPKYPAYGIRIRPGCAPPYVRNRISSSPSTNGTGLSPNPRQTSNSEGVMPQSHSTASGLMLPPVSTATPSSLGSSTPLQVEDQPSGYFSNPAYPQNGSVHRQDDGSLSLQGSFLGSYESSADLHNDPVDKRYSTPNFPERTSFYNHGYQPTSEITSPSSAQPTPQFPPTPVSHSSQYGSSSQHQPDYYLGNYGGVHGFNSDSLRSGGRDNSAGFISDRSDSNSTFIGSHDKMSMNGFGLPSDDIHQGQCQFKGRSSQISRGQDWMSSADGGDPYWYKMYSE